MNHPCRNRRRAGSLLLAAAKDRNHDRIPDRWEKRHHLSLHKNQAKRDQDRDHLRNRAEFMAGDNPRDRDSDDDGVMDGEENAGTISSFDAQTGRLTINLFNGDTISGLVNDGTEIKCEEEEHAATASHDGGDSSGPGSGDDHAEPGDDDTVGEGSDEQRDNSGPGSVDSGRDHGDEQENDDDEHHRACGTEALVEGAVVEEAELELEHGQTFFEEVELAD
jgi:hypothetical protein